MLRAIRRKGCRPPRGGPPGARRRSPRGAGSAAIGGGRPVGAARAGRAPRSWRAPRRGSRRRPTFTATPMPAVSETAQSSASAPSLTTRSGVACMIAVSSRSRPPTRYGSARIAPVTRASGSVYVGRIAARPAAHTSSPARAAAARAPGCRTRPRRRSGRRRRAPARSGARDGDAGAIGPGTCRAATLRARSPPACPRDCRCSRGRPGAGARTRAAASGIGRSSRGVAQRRLVEPATAQQPAHGTHMDRLAVVRGAHHGDLTLGHRDVDRARARPPPGSASCTSGRTRRDRGPRPTPAGARSRRRPRRRRDARTRPHRNGRRCASGTDLIGGQRSAAGPARLSRRQRRGGAPGRRDPARPDRGRPPRRRGRTGCIAPNAISSIARSTGQRGAVGTVVRHRVERVGDREDARGQRDLLVPQAHRVARTVPSLVVGAHDLDRAGQEPDRLHDVGADRRVLAHHPPFGLRPARRACTGSARGCRPCRCRAARTRSSSQAARPSRDRPPRRSRGRGAGCDRDALRSCGPWPPRPGRTTSSWRRRCRAAPPAPSLSCWLRVRSAEYSSPTSRANTASCACRVGSSGSSTRSPEGRGRDVHRGRNATPRSARRKASCGSARCAVWGAWAIRDPQVVPRIGVVRGRTTQRSDRLGSSL